MQNSGQQGGGQPAAAAHAAGSGGPARSAPPASNRGTRGSASDTRAGASYNQRHQQAKARRRSRINERLEALRQLVPHTERANTANFLEEVVVYVQGLQGRLADLEQQLGLPTSMPCAQPPMHFTAADDTPEQTMLPSQIDDRYAGNAQPDPFQTQSAPPGLGAQVQAALLLLQQAQAQQQAQQQQQQLQALLQQVQQQQVQQQQQQQQVHVQLHPQPQPVPQFNLKLQPPPPAGVSNPQDSGAGFPASTVGGGGRCSGSGGGGGGCDSGRCPQSASVDKLVIAAADSLGALSAGGGSRRSASTPAQSQGRQRSEEDAAQAVRQVRGSPQGIPTDEELDMLHEHLANIPQQDNNKRRCVRADR
ncbi:hypothetical protein D9Q98_008554 [Chlorella vulgaris]|uniref:BHLH domain-containing protein n=1 Tax=Chlorella vulgaris TaxID=3077 RepID=A0A9D4TIA7_CHLVU|nr:hypothetical protein D9Q98_008554 [Chlorella vulgaris]